MKIQDDYWSDYWRKDGAGGEVFVDAAGNKPKYLVEHWQAQFSAMESVERVLDVACGGGSIFEDLTPFQLAQLQLYATDLSQSALDILKQRMPRVTTSCGSATSMEYTDANFSCLVSQFGIEYAGNDAFREAARVLAPRGQLNFLMHVEDGYIDLRNKSLLIGAKAAISSQFIPTAIELIKASFKGTPSKLRKAKQTFQIAERKLSACMREHPEGIHQHLYMGFLKMYSKYQAYHQQDIVGWLQIMHKDIKKMIDKVQAIRDVSLSTDNVDEIKDVLCANEVTNIEVSTLRLPTAEEEHLRYAVAWHLKAIK